MSRTIHMTLSDEASAELARIADARGLSTGEALRRSLNLLRSENETIVKMDVLQAENVQLQKRVTELTGHLDWIDWGSEGIVKARTENERLRATLQEIRAQQKQDFDECQRLRSENERLTAELAGRGEGDKC